MNATLLILSSAVGGDVTPAGWGERATAVVQAGGCTNCGPGHASVAAPTYAPAYSSGGCCDSGSGGRTRLLDRLKARFGGRGKKADCGCGPAPVASGYSPTYPANPGVYAPGCASPLPYGAAPVVPGTPGTPPKEMPKVTDPKDPKAPKELPKNPGGDPDKGGAAGPAAPIAPPAVRPTPTALPQIPTAPVAAPRTGSPY